MALESPADGDPVAAAPSSVLSADFRHVLGHFPTGVCVITSLHNGQPIGFTCQSFFSLSLDPPMVAIAPGARSTTWPHIAAAGKFCVNVLSEDHEGVAVRFAQSGADKFAGQRWAESPSGCPVLAGASAWIDCSIASIVEAGDHFLVTASVVALEAATDEPLIFFKGAFGGYRQARRV